MKFRKLISLLLAAALMLVSFAGCGKDSGKQEPAEATYTYNSYFSSSQVMTFSPMEWEYSDEGTVMDLTQRGFYSIIYSPDSDYQYINEMAAAAPVDVTSDYAGSYSIPDDASKGYAFKIALRENACWEDGTPINADTYIYSYKQMLDPQQQCYRASGYTTGTYAIANANKYFCGGVEYVPYEDPDTGEAAAKYDESNAWVSLSSVCSGYWGMSYNKAYDEYPEYWIAEDGTDYYLMLSDAMGGRLWAEAEGDVKTALKAIAQFQEGSIEEYCAFSRELEQVSWDEVGIIKNDDYTITMIYETPMVSEYQLYYGLSGVPLVNEDLYEANKKDAGGLIKSSYATSVDTYSSYGPYKLSTWQEDKEITLEKNENWYGYSDSEFEGQYQTTNIVYQYIDEHATAMQLFLQGKLDDVSVSSTDFDTYASSDYIVYTPTSYTAKLSFNTDKQALASRQTDGVNKTIAVYKDFRQAFAMSINRSKYCQSIAPAYSPSLVLFNDNYIYDIDTFALYRDTDEAKSVIKTVYGSETATGYDVAKSKELFESAYKAALAAGDIKDGDIVKLELNVAGISDSVTNEINFFNDSLAEASKGTSLEGRIFIEAKEVDDTYASMSNGTADMIWSIWGGSDNDVYSMVKCYCVEDLYNDCEHGFDSSVEFTAEIDGNSYTMSFEDWDCELRQGIWAAAEAKTRLQVLAAIEANILLQYNTTPICSEQDAYLLSQKVEYVTYDYSIYYSESFGGIRFMTYNYSDAEWEDFCSENNYRLTY